jgi:hypothetical protein
MTKLPELIYRSKRTLSSTTPKGKAPTPKRDKAINNSLLAGLSLQSLSFPQIVSQGKFSKDLILKEVLKESREIG